MEQTSTLPKLVCLAFADAQESASILLYLKVPDFQARRFRNPQTSPLIRRGDNGGIPDSPK